MSSHSPRSPCSRRCDFMRRPIQVRRDAEPLPSRARGFSGSDATPRHPCSSRKDTGVMTIDLYQTITDRILGLLAQGVVPWRSPVLGQGLAGRPRNLISQREYRGINAFLLGITAYVEGYASAEWLTFRQAQTLGGSVRRGEASTLVVFWKQHKLKDKETGEDKIVPVLRYFRLFNREQCDGLPTPPQMAESSRVRPTPIAAAETIAANYPNPPQIAHVGSQPCHVPSKDRVQMPPLDRFASAEDYHSTLFHELVHSTAHSTRLDRGIDTNPQPFGSSEYAKEELVAEIGGGLPVCRGGHQPERDLESSRLHRGLDEETTRRQAAHRHRRRSGAESGGLDPWEKATGV